MGSEMAPSSLIGLKGSMPSKKWICSTMSGRVEVIQRWKGRKPVFKDPQVSNRLQSSMGSEVGPSLIGRVGKPLLIVMGIGGRVLWHCESMWLCTTMKQAVGWGVWGSVVVASQALRSASSRSALGSVCWTLHRVLQWQRLLSCFLECLERKLAS